MGPEAGAASPMDAADSALLDGARLPLVARHRLRLLAHSLRTLQSIAGRRAGPAPTAEAIVAWARTQEPLADDPGFRAAFCQQLLTSSLLLTEIADGLRNGAGGCDPAVPIDSAAPGPLGLGLHQLIAWCEQRREDPPTEAP